MADRRVVGMSLLIRLSHDTLVSDDEEIASPFIVLLGLGNIGSIETKSLRGNLENSVVLPLSNAGAARGCSGASLLNAHAQTRSSERMSARTAGAPNIETLQHAAGRTFSGSDGGEEEGPDDMVRNAQDMLMPPEVVLGESNAKHGRYEGGR